MLSPWLTDPYFGPAQDGASHHQVKHVGRPISPAGCQRQQLSLQRERRAQPFRCVTGEDRTQDVGRMDGGKKRGPKCTVLASSEDDRSSPGEALRRATVDADAMQGENPRGPTPQTQRTAPVPSSSPVPHPTRAQWSSALVRSSDFWIHRLPASSHRARRTVTLWRVASPVTAAGP